MKIRMTRLSDGSVCLFGKRTVNGQLRMYMTTSPQLADGEKLGRDEFMNLALELVDKIPLNADRLQLAGNG